VNPEQRPSPPPEITPLELKERLDREQPLLLVDVREAFEREIADLPDHGQRHIPLGELSGRAQELDRDRPLVLYCRTGSRSAWAAQFLQAQGFETVLNLSGGVMRWREEIDPTLQAY
jgi:adenylyltransferase/sulfurtransferase